MYLRNRSCSHTGRTRSVLDCLEPRRLLAAAPVPGYPAITAVPPEIGIITEYVHDVESDGHGHSTGHLTTGDGAGSGDSNSGGGSVAGAFDIVVNLTGSVTSAVEAAFAAAEAKWEAILLGDLPNATAWDINDDLVSVDDVYIDASVVPMDGEGGVLGSAGPRYIRSDSGLPITGVMRFDSADLDNMVSNGSLTNVIVHEMGHVLGIGTLWNGFGLVGGTSSDPHFTGSEATAELQTFTGAGPAGPSIEDDGGGGTAGGHWNEDGESHRHSFHNELMTGYINGGSNPLSRMTAASLADMGYPEVNFDGADLYNLPNGNDFPRMSGLTAEATEQGVLLSGVNPTDGDAIAEVGFWLESNGMPGLQAGTSTPDLFIGADATSDGGYTLDVDGTELTIGSNTFHARPTDSLGAVGEVRTATVDYQPDTDPPILDASSFHFETSQTVVFEFSETLGDVAPADLVVLNQTTGQTVDPAGIALVRTPLATGERLEFTFTDLLADGNYLATLPAGSVDDGAGNAITGDATLAFFALAGDTDRDRDVDFFDFLTLRSNYNGTGTFSDGDFDYDGDVDFFDFLALRGNYNVTLPPPGGGSLFSDDGTDEGGGDSDVL